MHHRRASHAGAPPRCLPRCPANRHGCRGPPEQPVTTGPYLRGGPRRPPKSHRRRSSGLERTRPEWCQGRWQTHNVIMPRAPLIVAVSSVAALLVWAAHLALDPGPFATAPAGVLAVSLAIGSIMLGSALMISRAGWARPAAVAAALAGLSLAAVTPLDAGTVIGLVLSGAALAGSLGPWLAGWLRRLPSAEAPPRNAALALAGTSLLPAAAAVVRFDGLAAFDWVLITAATAAALGLLRGRSIGLWLARLAVPAAGIGAGFAGLPAGLILTAAAIAVTAPAWQPEVRLSVLPVLPSTGNAAIPPELVDPDLLEAAGFDDRGRGGRLQS